MRQHILGLALPLLLLIVCCDHSRTPISNPSDVLTVAADSAASVAVMPAGLPQHLGIGLMNQPDQLAWMTGSGTPWDYRYQYLTGGVNTGQGWTTWSNPPGAFADMYLEASGENGYIPVLTYYQIIPSAPNPGDENVFPKLQNSSTMQAYYAEWKLLMQKAEAYGDVVLVHVEPDLWGYMQYTYGEDASAVPVKVAASGFGEVAGYPNTAAGFAQALTHLRDVYAPNVLLGYHFSQWATGEDLILDEADPVGTADQQAAFYQSLGASFDLIFFDPSDRDAAYYEIIHGDSGEHWWDDADYERYRTFLGRLVERTGRRAMLWQVPVGNTLYRSMNNSWGHYQDNRVEYWLGERQHLVEYADAGVIAVLFGAGASGCTLYTDEAGDGITNPPPINGNVLYAQYPDDDGGYLRLRAAQYYQEGPVPLDDSPPQGDDSDGDGCADSEELGTNPALGGMRDPLNPYDFYDVPVPTAFNGGTPADRDKAVTIVKDLLAVLEYSGTSDGGPCNVGPDHTPGTADDRCYNQDKNGDGEDDGLLYDRSVSPTWSDAPDGAVTAIVDALLVLEQSGHSCAAPP